MAPLPSGRPLSGHICFQRQWKLGGEFWILPFALTGLPFALLSWRLIAPDARPLKTVFSVLLVVATWLAAYTSHRGPIYLEREIRGNDFFLWLVHGTPVLGGVISGFGIAVALSLLSPALANSGCRWKAVIIGGVVGYPCGLCIFNPGLGSVQRGWTLDHLAFIALAVWQSTVGTYLYFVSRSSASPD